MMRKKSHEVGYPVEWGTMKTGFQCSFLAAWTTIGYVLWLVWLKRFTPPRPKSPVMLLPGFDGDILLTVRQYRVQLPHSFTTQNMPSVFRLYLHPPSPLALKSTEPPNVGLVVTDYLEAGNAALRLDS